MSTAAEGGFGASVAEILTFGEAGESERELGGGEDAGGDAADVVGDLTGTVRLGGG